MEGAEVGLDVHATMALYRRKQTTDYERGVLRSIFSGAVCTRARLHKAGVVDSPVCFFVKARLRTWSTFGGVAQHGDIIVIGIGILCSHFGINGQLASGIVD